MQGATCRGGLRGILVVPGQTDWCWRALLVRPCAVPDQSFYTKTAGWGWGLCPERLGQQKLETRLQDAFRTPSGRRCTTRAKVPPEQPRSIKRRHAQPGPVPSCSI